MIGKEITNIGSLAFQNVFYMSVFCKSASDFYSNTRVIQ